MEGNHHINDFLVFDNFKESEYQLPQSLKVLKCLLYVIKTKVVYEIY